VRVLRVPGSLKAAGPHAQSYRRFRCRDCGRQFNERSAGVLNTWQREQVGWVATVHPRERGEHGLCAYRNRACDACPTRGGGTDDSPGLCAPTAPSRRRSRRSHSPYSIPALIARKPTSAALVGQMDQLARVLTEPGHWG
jgi:hypothetical protein